MTDEQEMAEPTPLGPPPVPVIPPPLPADLPIQQSRRRINPAAWLACLFFRPGKFFTEYARFTPMYLVVFCVIMLGATKGVGDLVDAFGQDLTPEQQGEELGSSLLAGAVVGVVWYFLLGSWYGVRVFYCKPQGMSWVLARRTYAFASLIVSLSMVIGAIVLLIAQDRQVMLALGAAIGVAFAWSIYVSYRGVRTLFAVARGRAIVLFIILPAIVYGAALTLPYQLGKINQAAILASGKKTPVAFENDYVTLNYPSCWREMAQPEQRSAIFVDGDTVFGITVMDGTRATTTPHQGVLIMAQAQAEAMHTTATEAGSFQTWSNFTGIGNVFTMNVEGQTITSRIFIAYLPDDRYIIVTEAYNSLSEERTAPQFQIVRDSLVIKPAR